MRIEPDKPRMRGVWWGYAGEREGFLIWGRAEKRRMEVAPGILRIRRSKIFSVRWPYLLNPLTLRCMCGGGYVGVELPDERIGRVRKRDPVRARD